MPGIPMPVKLAVIKESRPGEDRVAIVPEVASKLAKTGVDVVVQSGAGTEARFADQGYVDAADLIAVFKAKARHILNAPGSPEWPRSAPRPC